MRWVSTCLLVGSMDRLVASIDSADCMVVSVASAETMAVIRQWLNASEDSTARSPHADSIGDDDLALVCRSVLVWEDAHAPVTIMRHFGLA
jgi:hypothetical protein